MRKADYFTLAKISAPLITRGFVMAVQLAGKRAILGKKDEKFLADYAYIASLESLIFLLVYGSFTIINAEISQAHARVEIDKSNIRQVDPTKIGMLYQRGVALGLFLMIPAGIISFFAPTIFRLTEAPSSVVEESKTYFIYGFASYFFDMLYRTQTRSMIGLSRPMFALMGDTGEAVLDIAFTYLFVRGTLGFPKMGVSGAAIAYAIAAAITAFASFVYLRYFSPELNQYVLFQRIHSVDFLATKKMISDGLHIGFSWAIESLTMILLTFYCGLSGTTAQVGIQVAASYSYFLGFCVSGLAQAASIMVGNTIVTDSQHARMIGNRTFQMNIIFSLLGFIGICLNANGIARLFLSTDNQQEILKITPFLRLQGVIEILSSVRNTGLNILPCCNDTQYSFFLTIAFLLVLNSAIATAAQFLFGSAADITYGTQIVGYAMSAAGTLYRWKVQTDKFQLLQCVFKLESPRHEVVEEVLPVGDNDEDNINAMEMV